MEFNFDCERILNCDNNGFSIINSDSKKYIPESSLNYINNIIRLLGEYSSHQRHIDFIATTPENFFLDDINETIIIKAKKNYVIGFIRFGFKNILLRNCINYSKPFIKKLLTIIDFYVSFNVQRKHYGKEIFDKVIKMYNIPPYYMAYDIPNKIMFNFLYKNYLMRNPIQQDNDIVVYHNFVYENENKKFENKNNFELENNNQFNNEDKDIHYNNSYNYNYNNDYNGDNFNNNLSENNLRNINLNEEDNKENKNNEENYGTEYTDNYNYINKDFYNKKPFENTNKVDLVYNIKENNNNELKLKPNNNLGIKAENNRYSNSENIDNKYKNKIIPKRLIYSENNNFKTIGENIISRNYSEGNVNNRKKYNILYPITPSFSCSPYEQNILNSIQSDDYNKFNNYFLVTDNALKNKNFFRKNYNYNSYDQNEYFHKMVDQQKKFFSNRLNNIRNLENIINNSRKKIQYDTINNNSDYYHKNKYFATIFDKVTNP